MNMKKAKVIYGIIMGIVLTVSATPCVASNIVEQEEDESKTIDLYGYLGSTYNDGTDNRNLIYFPITAYIESSVLYICNDKPAGALDIAIISGKSGRVVWEQVVPETATSLVTIPLDALPAGEYTLQLANEWGGYLCGSFRK